MLMSHQPLHVLQVLHTYVIIFILHYSIMMENTAITLKKRTLSKYVDVNSLYEIFGQKKEEIRET